MDLAGYRQAVIHLAWLRDDQVQHLLFGMVELRPIEFPAATGCLPKTRPAVPGGNKELRYRRCVVPAAEAIQWYKGAAGGGPTLVPHDDTELVSGPFIQEPPWPHCLVSSELPFAPDWMNVSRIHYLFRQAALSPWVSRIIQNKQNSETLQEWLNFDIVDVYREYQGAMCLVAPNPVFRSIERSHLEHPREQSAETVAYKIIARQGQRVSGLRLEISNERLPGRMSPVVRTFAEEAIEVVDFPVEVYKEGRSVTDPHRGLLHWQEPYPIIRSIRTRMGLIHSRKKIKVPARSRQRPAYEYVVDEVETLGEGGRATEPDDSFTRLLDGESRRARRKAAKEYDQKWFFRAPGDAVQYVRQIIGSARSAVLIVDPFFAGVELLEFGHAIQRHEVRLRILTSGKAFRRVDYGDTHEKSEAELDAILNATFVGYSTKPDIRILGNRSSIHDRFLVVDGHIWLSGNSLNAIGDRAGMIVKLPDPEPVIASLEAIWRTARPLAADRTVAR